jgi:hypothetical protein
MENQPLRRKYDFKMTKLGVMYMIYKIPSSTPKPYHGDLLTGHLLQLDEAFTAMNMDGVFDPEFRLAGEDDDNFFYLIKFIPSFDRINLWFLIKYLAISTLLIFIIHKFNLLDGKEAIINSIKTFINSTLDKV